MKKNSTEFTNFKRAMDKMMSKKAKEEINRKKEKAAKGKKETEEESARIAEAHRMEQELKLERTTKEGSAAYIVAKDRLSIRLTAPYSEERRKAASERAKRSALISGS